MKVKVSDGDDGRQAISLVGLRPWPEIAVRDEKPYIVFWLRDVYLCSLAAQPRGETNGDAAAVATKNRAGCPKKSTDSDNLGIQGELHKHMYLEREDSTPISITELRALSQKAHSLWQLLHVSGYAPRTWGKITSVAWEYYARSMLNTPGLKFLRLCNDSQWKLKEWTQLSYSPWAKRNGVREGCPKKEPGEDSPLNNEDLIQMEPGKEEVPEYVDPEGGTYPYDSDNAQHHADNKNKTSDSGQTSQEASHGEIMHPPVHPFAYSLRQNKQHIL